MDKLREAVKKRIYEAYISSAEKKSLVDDILALIDTRTPDPLTILREIRGKVKDEMDSVTKRETFDDFDSGRVGAHDATLGWIDAAIAKIEGGKPCDTQS